MNARRWFAAVLVTVLAAGLYAADTPAKPAGEKVMLKVRYVPGDYVVSIQMSTDQTIEMGGNQMAQKMSQAFDMGLQVDEPDSDKNTRMTLSYKRVRQTLQMQGQTMKYDSDAKGDSDPTLAKAFAPLLKMKVAMTIGPDGKVKSVSGLDTLWDEMAKGDPGMAQMAGMMKKSMGDKTMQQMVDNMMVANLPNKAVAVGEGWSQKIDMAVPVLGKLDCENKFTLKSVEQTAAGKEAVVAVAGKASSSKAHTAQMGPMQMTVNGFSMKMNGQNRFNVANPLLVTSQMTQSGSLDMTMTPPQEGQEPMVVKTKFDTKVTMTGRKAPKAESKTDGKSEKKAK